MHTVIRRWVRKNQGKELTVSTMAINLGEALESDPRTWGVLTGEREDLPMGFQFYWQDIIVVFLQALIEEQHEQCIGTACFAASEALQVVWLREVFAGQWKARPW
jgi:hypothetical protein